MIKRIAFVSRRAEVSAAEFGARWVASVAPIQAAPATVRPLRAVVCTTLHDIPGSGALHDGLSLLSFPDVEALRRFDAWQAREVPAPDLVDPERTVQVIAEEVVLRGADWLVRRWKEGSLKYKHMALARRAESLTPSQFSERWRSRAGRIGGSATTPVLAIPEAAQGSAYIQNHPLASAGYDAINEVYFDDLEAMRARLDFFREHDPRRADADLVSAAHFLVVREQVVVLTRS